jgi:protein-tyrosine phosphatase
MIDIHCHILPSIDDGAANMVETIEMSRLAYADGIRHIIATPHFNNLFHNTVGTVNRLVPLVQQALNRAGIDITIHPGNEVRLESKDFIFHHTLTEQYCYLAGNAGFILLEQSWHNYYEPTLDIVRWFQDRGTRIIIPHPERHSFFRSDPQLLVTLIEAGVWTQVSVDSLLGKNSDAAQQFAEWLIQHNYAHTLATDAHNTRRKPNLSVGFDIVERFVGADRVTEMKDRARSILPV